MADPYIGEIRMFAGNFAPAGWMLCQGQILNISEYDALFNLIGTTYGGDGQSTFALPDLRGRIPIHAGTNGNTYPLGQMAGTESVALTVNQIPSHTHAMIGQTKRGNTNSPQDALWAKSTLNQFAVPPTDPSNMKAMNSGSISPAGGSQPHENMMPYLAVNFIISLFGVFPSPT